jgi:hypothetical protein
MAAAEAKLDAKVRALDGLKTDIQGLLNQTEAKQNTEVDRLVKVFEAMRPKDAGPRMMLLDDSVRLPIAAKMKERSLSAVLAQMPPAEAKKLTEALAARFNSAKAMAVSAQATANRAANQVSGPAPSGAAGSAVTAEVGGITGAAAPPPKPAAKRKAPPKPVHNTAPTEAQAAAPPPPAKTAAPAPATPPPAAAKAG